MNRTRAHISNAEIIGRLGQEPELQYTERGVPFARLSVATSETFTDKSGAIRKLDEWHRAVAWGKEAAEMASGFKKGDSLILSGGLRINGYEKDGIKHRVADIDVAAIRVNEDALPSKNEVRLLGTVREEPKYRELDNGNAMAVVSIATRVTTLGADGASHEREDWHHVTLWGRKAAAARDIHAGDTVAVNGNLRHRTLDTEDGHKRHLTSVDGFRFQVLDRTNERGTSSERPSAEIGAGAEVTAVGSTTTALPGPAPASGAALDKATPKRKSRTQGKGTSLGE